MPMATTSTKLAASGMKELQAISIWLESALDLTAMSCTA